MPRDYGYFGKGSTGYAQYMTAFRRSRKGGGGGGGSRGGCFLLLLGGLVEPGNPNPNHFPRKQPGWLHHPVKLFWYLLCS